MALFIEQMYKILSRLIFLRFTGAPQSFHFFFFHPAFDAESRFIFNLLRFVAQ